MVCSNPFVERLEPRKLLSASMVKDINTAPPTLSGLWSWVSAGDTAFLSLDEAVNVGWELFKSDGTSEGTVLVKDIRPGRDNSQPGWLTHAGNGAIFFAADNGTHGSELWKSDGTEAGTVMVKDINPGTAGSTPAHLVNVNGTIYFSANDGVNGAELWKSDGTETGTVLVKNIAAAAGASSSPQHLINNNGIVYFRATDSSTGSELWKSDGTATGTDIVRDLWSGSSSGMLNAPMAVSNGFVYFSGTNGTNSLYKSDGTSGGTVPIGTGMPTVSTIKASGGSIYYSVGVSPNFGVWHTDGTSPATRIHTDTGMGLTDVNGTLFFGSAGTLYTANGTVVTALKSGLSYNSNSASFWTHANGVFYFGATDNAAGLGEELWKSDGTPGGTVMIKDLVPGPGSSTPIGIVPLGPNGSSGVFFGTVNGPDGGALYRTDGTADGTVVIKDINAATADSTPFLLTTFNGHVYFTAFEPAYAASGGAEIYRSDGTAAGTGIFADLNPGPTGSSPSSLSVFGNHLYFAANDGSGIGKELWRTDGTNVSLLKDIEPGAGSSNPGIGTVSGDYMFFFATTATHGEELWRTDGTSTGTIRLTNNASGAFTNWHTDVDGRLYFAVYSSTSAFTGLFFTDGNSVTGIATSFTGLSSMRNVNGTLYIAATTSANGSELYKIGPGDTAPVLVKDIHTTGSSSPANFTNVDGTLFFTASTSANGIELWKSDGTTAGTVMIKDIRAGSLSSSPTGIVAANGVAYFRADDGVVGQELWRSDGTAAGTYLLKDINPGVANSSLVRLYFSHGFVYFAADDGTNGFEGWRTDGTPQGTAMLGDFYPEGSLFSQPSNFAFFAPLNGEVLYSYSDETHGRELWKAHQPDFAVPGVSGILNVSATGNNDIIDISASGSGLAVTLNGLSETFAPGAISTIVLQAHSGKDNLTINNAAVKLAGPATLSHFALNGSAALDLADSMLLLSGADVGTWNGSGYTGITGMVQSGRIIAASDMIVGIAEVSGIVRLRATRAGDANLDGVINGDDFFAIDAGFSAGATGYAGGDFNLDGHIDADDYWLIDSNYNKPPLVFSDPPAALLAAGSELPAFRQEEIYSEIDDLLVALDEWDV